MNPVATTVTLNSSLALSSITAPKIILASSAAAVLTISAAVLISPIFMSEPPVILMMMPLAPSMEYSSSGLEIASSAARRARSSPLFLPIPTKAEPASDIIARTSAKSRLIVPGTVIRSEMP